MIRLTREVRFSTDRDWAGRVDFARPVTNSWGGWPSAVGLVPYLRLRATVAGEPDPRTGYLCNITVLDDLLRREAIPFSTTSLAEHGWRMPAEHLLEHIWERVAGQTPAHAPLVELELLVTPYLRYTIRAEDQAGGRDAAVQEQAGKERTASRSAPATPQAPTATQRHAGGPAHTPSDTATAFATNREHFAMILLTQQFEFSAAHRLHCSTLSDEENRRVFGKCNNPTGHGHNYLLEVTVAGRPDERTGAVLPLPQFEALVKERVIDHFDHKHLNADTQEFRTLNPSVENIAQVIWDLLVDGVAPAKLHRVRVWETPKTWAEVGR